MTAKKALPYDEARKEITKHLRQNNGIPPSVRELKTVCGDQGGLATYSGYLKRWEREQANQKGLAGQIVALKAQIAASNAISMAMITQMEAQLRRAEHADEMMDDECAEISENSSQPEFHPSAEARQENLDQFHSPWENDTTGKWDISDYDYGGAEEYDAQTMEIIPECKVRFLDDVDDAESRPAALTDECLARNETEQAQPASLLLEEKLLETETSKLPRSLSAAPIEGGITQGPNADVPHGSSLSRDDGGADD